MKEKRRFIRFILALKVDYTTQKEPGILKTGTTKDVCAGGIQLLTKEKLEKGKKVGLKIFIPDASNPVHLSGKVMWSKETAADDKLPYTAGIEFGKIEEDNKDTFLRFLCDLMYKKIEKPEMEGG